MFDLAEGLSQLAGSPRRLPPADALIERAVRRTGLSDFGDWAFEPAMRVLLTAMDRDADLSLFGRLAGSWDFERFLSNLLQLRAMEKATPVVLSEPITAPLVISGLPRSGTTFLHRLLAEDPAHRAPLCWETIYPYPSARDARTDRRAERVDRQLRMFEAMAPQFRAAHPMTAHSPQECSEITAHDFRSLRFETTHRVPSYREWLDATGHGEGYRFHRRFLQHLQAQAAVAGHGRPRWVLKCPDHVFALDALRAEYPDVRLVLCHRDPLKILASNASLAEILRRPFTRRVDRADLGRQEAARWRRGVTSLMEAAQADAGRSPGIFHVRYTELVADPLGTVSALYRHFGLPLGDEAARRMREAVLARPDGGYRPRRYSLNDYGLDPAHERRRFDDYVDFFGVAREAIPGLS